MIFALKPILITILLYYYNNNNNITQYYFYYIQNKVILFSVTVKYGPMRIFSERFFYCVLVNLLFIIIKL